MKIKPDPVGKFVALLESFRGWVTAKQLSNFASDRWLRVLANASNGKIITGQKGYKAARHATRSEILHSAHWLEHQASEMLQRARVIRKVANQTNAADFKTPNHPTQP
ncbi:MAG: hypothetical protein C5B47_07970 [Verrucomicrobia bacterium]|nr:MAG: hypothetical protein C5B47_07970 [Verrucomicrobiota bacterium]